MSDTQSPLQITKCFLCDTPPKSMCRHCGQDFCDSHSSRYDDRFCSNCIGDENTKFEDLPLIDDEGVTHQGRQIRLIGEGWPHALEMLSALSDEELELKIIQWKSLLKHALLTGEFYRITVSAAEFEKEERHDSKRRKLEYRREELRQGTLRVNAKAVKVDDAAAKLSKQLGIPIGQARDLIELLKKQRGV